MYVKQAQVETYIIILGRIHIPSGSHNFSKRHTLEGHDFFPNVELSFTTLGVGSVDIYDIHSL